MINLDDFFAVAAPRELMIDELKSRVGSEQALALYENYIKENVNISVRSRNDLPSEKRNVLHEGEVYVEEGDLLAGQDIFFDLKTAMESIQAGLQEKDLGTTIYLYQ